LPDLYTYWAAKKILKFSCRLPSSKNLFLTKKKLLPLREERYYTEEKKGENTLKNEEMFQDI